MAFNSNEAFNSALSLFCSLYEDMNPADLPEGLSPDNQDVWFLPGSVQTRPGLQGLFASLGLVDINSMKDYPPLSGSMKNVFVDSLGVLRSRDVKTGSRSTIGNVSANPYFRAENAFGKQWYAFYQIIPFAGDNPFVGYDVPRYYDGTNIWRVTSDAPGAPITVADSGTAGTTTAGVHKAVVMFKSFNGAITAPSVPFTFTSAGTLKWNVSNIPIGPPGTQARILAFTAAAGSAFTYITAVTANGITTVINDNTSTTAVVDFTDTLLLAGTPIDQPGNNLFNQVVLAPCLGVIEYQSRLFWWGEINNIKNFLNMSFDGGYLSTSAAPLGWSTTYTTGGTFLLGASPDGLGFALQMTSAGGVKDCAINQPAFEDFYGAPIVAGAGRYYFRCQASVTGNSNNAARLRCEIYSATGGGVISTGSVLPGGSFNWTSVLMSALPATIPTDAELRIYLDSFTAAAVVTIDEIQLINSAQPVLAQQARASYVNNPYGYDVVTGIIGVDTSANITAAFKQHGYLYFLTTEELHQTQNNGSTEPFGWTLTEFARACGCSGPNAVDDDESIAVWSGRYGVRIFSGSVPAKISQEIQPTWDTINWQQQITSWVVNDAVSKIIYVAVPLGEFLSPNSVYAISYRSVNANYEVPDPLHISYSGKMICSDLSRKTTRWNIRANCGAMLTTSLPDSKQMAFGSGGVSPAFGRIYTLNPLKYVDDDYGVISSYYTTYFFFNHDTEQNVPLLGLHRKLFTYFSAFVTGVGNLMITPLVDTTSNAWPTFPQAQLSQNLTHDIEWPANVVGERIAFKISVVPLSGGTDAAFNLKHAVVSARMEKNFPVRGAFL